MHTRGSGFEPLSCRVPGSFGKSLLALEKLAIPRRHFQVFPCSIREGNLLPRYDAPMRKVDSLAIQETVCLPESVLGRGERRIFHD